MRGRFNGRVIGQDYTGRNTRHNGRAGVYNAVQSAFAPSLDITLANGLGPLFTYTRATTATVTDFEGLIKSCLSGELRVQGARRVQNWLTNSTDSSTWSTATSGTGTATKTDNYGTAPDGTLTAARLVATKGSGYGVVRIPKTGNLPGTAIQQTCWIKSNTAGSQNVELGNISVAYATVTVTPTWKRLTPGVQTVSAGGASSLEIGAGGSGADASIDILIWHPQMEDVTGQSNQNPSEYVSVGVESTPYHGYFVDGVKYFSYQNGNTVASNVVTEAQGAAITGTIGYLAEGARTNLQKQNRTLTTAPWKNQGTPAATQNATGIDGATTAWTLTDNDAGAVEHIYCDASELALSGSTQYTYSIFVGKQGSAPSGYPCISVDNGTYLAGCTIDPYNGTATVWTAYTGFTVLTSSATCTSWNSNFWRVELTFTTHSSMTTGTVVIIPAGRTSANSATGTNDVSATGATVFDAPQIEAGAFASSPIITTTAAVARNADVLTCAFSGIGNDAQGAAYIEAVTFSTTGNGSSSIPLAFSSNGSLLYLNSGDARTVANSYDGTTVVTKTGLTDISTALRKRACSWGNGGMSITGDGAAPATSVFDGSLGSTSITIGAATGGTSQWFGVIKTVRLYRTKLSDAQLQSMTS